MEQNQTQKLCINYLWNLKRKSPDKNIEAFFMSDPKGIRTPITAVKGRGPNH
jgi:hypothetical protein